MIAADGAHDAAIGRLLPQILSAQDKVTAYAASAAGRAACLGPDRVWGIEADRTALFPAATPDPASGDVGRNSFYTEGWLPPDPPTGHGSHDYVFQLFALNEVPSMGPSPGRDELVAALEGRVVAAGLLVGTYSRGEEAPIGRVTAGLRPAT